MADGADWARAALDMPETWADRVSGRRVGVLTTAASRRAHLDMAHTGLGRPILGQRTDAVVAGAGGTVIRLFTPEHGLEARLDPGEPDDDSTYEDGIPVISLYGPRRRPTHGHLADLDVIVIDLPDVGCRAYTFASTMLGVLTVAAESGVPAIVLDRPNPLGRIAAGPGVSGDRTSFVAAMDIPLRHGLTMGEMALHHARQLGQTPPVVVRCDWDGRPCPAEALWYPPSPGLPTSETAFAYAGTVLLEGTNISEGRGTTRPFLTVGAPYLSAEALNDAMAATPIPGIMHWPTRFRPAFSKHQDAICGGVSLAITDRRRADPIALIVRLFAAIGRLSPDSVSASAFLGRLSGGEEARNLLLSGANPDEILEAWQSHASDFRQHRGPMLLYPDDEAAT